MTTLSPREILQDLIITETPSEIDEAQAVAQAAEKFNILRRPRKLEEGPRKHPAHVTADRLETHLAKWDDQFDGNEKQNIVDVIDSLRHLAYLAYLAQEAEAPAATVPVTVEPEGPAPIIQAHVTLPENTTFGGAA